MFRYLAVVHDKLEGHSGRPFCPYELENNVENREGTGSEIANWTLTSVGLWGKKVH